jgi:hypothetical protein
LRPSKITVWFISFLMAATSGWRGDKWGQA